MDQRTRELRQTTCESVAVALLRAREAVDTIMVYRESPEVAPEALAALDEVRASVDIGVRKIQFLLARP
jgi:hypothetical protein